jgi:hypothetical protein
MLTSWASHFSTNFELAAFEMEKKKQITAAVVVRSDFFNFDGQSVKVICI